MFRQDKLRALMVSLIIIVLGLAAFAAASLKWGADTSAQADYDSRREHASLV